LIFAPPASLVGWFADQRPQAVLPILAQTLPPKDTPSGIAPICGISVEHLPLPARLPDKALLAQIIRAMKAGTQLKVTYHSLTPRDEAENSRIIEPHALINSGLRWHMRAYNHDSYDFRDFVLSRFTSAQQLAEPAESNQNYDDTWTELVQIKLKAHPGLNDKQRTALNYDYYMLDWEIEIEARGALIGYVLQQLKVDTTADFRLNPNAYQLVVTNREEVEPFAKWAFL